MPESTLPQVPPQKEGLFNPSPNINPPPSATTASYKLNHLAIRITDPTPSLNFYINLLGMRIIFTMNAGPFTIYYLGHPPPDIQTAEALDTWAKKTSEIPNMTSTAGLLELYHVHGSESADPDIKGAGISTGNTPPHLGFAHLGFTVPDVPATVARLREAGVTILKDLGVCSRETVPLSEWEAWREIGRGEIHENYAWFFEKFAMVADPVSWIVWGMLLVTGVVTDRYRMDIRWS
jgi:lactoylglutathione lyase